MDRTSYADRMRSRMQRKMDIIGLKNLIHHSYLQFYKARDLETIEIYTSWLLSLEQNILLPDDIRGIRLEAENAFVSGDYYSILAKLGEGGGSYASKVKIEYLIDKINSNY